MIPKHIFSIWLSEKEDRPALINKCLASHNVPGYTYHLITLENCDRSSEYVRLALEKKSWVKASDYLRCQYMYDQGGIHLDADMEVLPGKDFDDLLDNKMFTSFECTGLYANAGFGAEAGHPLLKAYLDRIDANYKGDGDLVYEPGIRTFHDIFWAADKSLFTMVPTEEFFPYHHVMGTMNITPKTRVIHHYTKSWLK